MYEKSIFLSNNQIKIISDQFIIELHEKPLYDINAKKKLFIEYIKKVEILISSNASIFINDHQNSDDKLLLTKIVTDRMFIDEK